MLTARGFTPIGDVKVGDLVLTHRNHWKRVSATGSHIGDTIMLKGQGSPGIECTPNHPFWAGHRYRGPWDNARRRYPTLFAVDGWVPAADMIGRMWLNMGANVPELPIPAFDFTGCQTKDIALNTPFFYFVGRWLGDGWLNIHKRRHRVASYMKRVFVCDSYDNEHELEEKLVRAGLHFTKTRERTAVRFCCSSTALYDWLESNFGKGAAGKTIPAWAFGMRREWRKALLMGYADSDGSPLYRADGSLLGWRATTASRRLSIGIRMLAASLGYTGSCFAAPNRRPYAIIEKRIIHEQDQYPVSWYANARKSIVCDEGFWAPVRRTESGRSNVRVYDLTVEDDHSFTVDGIAVANCTDISVAGLRAGLREGTRSGLWSFQADAVAVKRPNLLVWENVGAALTTAASCREDARERERRARLLAAHGLCACAEPALPDVDGFTPPQQAGERPVDAAAALAAFLRHDSVRCAPIRCGACGRAVFQVMHGRVLAGDRRLDGVHTRPMMRALGRVLGDLAALGYDAVWRGLEAAAVGAPHHRLRVFVAAWPRETERVSRNRRLARLEALGPMREPDGLPFAVWDGERDVWATGRPDLFGDTPVFQDAWPKAGVMVLGRVWRLDADDRTVSGLLASPKACDGEKGGPNRSYGAGGGPLPAMVASLPAPRTSDANGAAAHGDGGMQLNPAVGLLPTPTSRDGKGRNQRNTPDCLPVAVEQAATGWGWFTPAIRRWEHIMGRPAPTPVQTSNALRKWMLKHADDPMLLDGHWPLDHMTGDDGHPRVDGPMRARVWRRFKAADRGESLGVTRFLAACRTYEPDSPIPVALQPIPQVFAWWRRASPDRVPVAANLAPRFVEWMMGLDDGWVTNPMIRRQVNGDSRNLQLRALGNGVVPRQAMAALDWCLDVRERLSASRGDA